MNNSDLLTFDYTQPVSELPHKYYKLYIINEKYIHELFGVYKKEDAYRIPEILDQLYIPEYRGFMIVGRHKNDYDDPLDRGDIIQETYKYRKKKEGKRSK